MKNIKIDDEHQGLIRGEKLINRPTLDEIIQELREDLRGL